MKRIYPVLFVAGVITGLLIARGVVVTINANNETEKAEKVLVEAVKESGHIMVINDSNLRPLIGAPEKNGAVAVHCIGYYNWRQVGGSWHHFQKDDNGKVWEIGTDMYGHNVYHEVEWVKK